MKPKVPKTAPVRASFFAKVVLPFVIPALLTLVLVITVGESWPRQIAPGSGLKLAGLLASGFTAVIVFAAITRKVAESRVHKAGALLCAVTGLMGWPVWTLGVLPSVNGSQLGTAQATPMVLENTEITIASRSSDRYHWAWLRPATAPGTDPMQADRYFISEELYTRWTANPPASVTLTTATGRLGAQVVTGFE